MINLKNINKNIVHELDEAFNEKGKVSLHFKIYDEDKNVTVNLLASKKAIKITDEVVDYLENSSNVFSYAINDGQYTRHRRVLEKATEEETEENIIAQDEPDANA